MIDTIKISHECPVSLLQDSIFFNDYQYCLVHLMEENEKYHDWFISKFRSSCPDGEILLDNSIFELGTSFEPEQYAVWAEKIQPNSYIVPDALEDYAKTITAFERFVRDYPDLPGAKIGVVQGKPWTEIVDCYKFMTASADCIAFSFDLSLYNFRGYGNNRLELCTTARQNCIARLISENIWNYNKPHHLLGCSLAREFRWYRENNVRGIRSLDTSNPVVAGLKGIRYNDTYGLTTKPSQKLFTMITHEVTADEVENINYNVEMFRQIVNGRDLR